MIDVKGLLLNLRRMRSRGRMSAIVGCASVLAGWESFCSFVLLSKSGCYFVGTTLIFVGTAVDYGRTSRASLLVNCESFCSFVLMSTPTSLLPKSTFLLSKSICTYVNSHFSCVKTNLRDAQNEITFSRYEVSNSASKDTKKTP